MDQMRATLTPGYPQRRGQLVRQRHQTTRRLELGLQQARGRLLRARESIVPRPLATDNHHVHAVAVAVVVAFVAFAFIQSTPRRRVAGARTCS